MITIHQTTEAGLQRVEHTGKGCWIAVTHPTPDEVNTLPQDLDIPKEFVSASLNRDELSRIEKGDRALLILVRIPHFRSQTANIPYIALPMGIIMTHEQVVTICQSEHQLLHHLPHEHQIDLSTATPTRFILHLLWSVADKYMHYLNEIEQIVEGLENRLQRSLQNREVLELLRYQKSLVHFTTALRANETMLERLHKSEAFGLEAKDEDLFDDVFTEYHQAISMSQIASDILSQMMDAFASIISNNLNVVMKFMASVAVILVVPTIVGTFYGMNVRLPLEDHPYVFIMLVGMSILISALIGVILWKKKWL